MIWLSDFLKTEYGTRLEKISIDAGFTCPNRDGSSGYGGCIFCSQEGSGDFTKGSRLTVFEQIEAGKSVLVEKDVKHHKNSFSPKEDRKYIAYFQAYTNTYGDLEQMEKIYLETAKRDDIAIISIATRPDCLGDDVLKLLNRISRIKPVWVELGLQTIHEATAKYIRRGYELPVYDEAVRKLSVCGVSQIITHVILGLPGETKDDILKTVKYVGDLAENVKMTCGSAKALINDGCVRFGIKLQLLHVLKGTDLASDYEAGLFECLTFDEYTDIAAQCLSILPEDMIVHRITGDGDQKKLIAPSWSTNKKKVMNTIRNKYAGLYCDKQIY